MLQGFAQQLLILETTVVLHFLQVQGCRIGSHLLFRSEFLNLGCYLLFPIAILEEILIGISIKKADGFI